ncbi:hypothetical protein [Thiothrix lacustris]|uniref:hypothetical protein n=1 Tax=Thiothrix lacustris TaxID=525917 RepID=UPI000B13B198|nr:hypothetical protein [Thiothrix lacustris]
MKHTTPPKAKRKPVFISEYLTQIDKAGGKPVALAKPKQDILIVKADYRINTP